MRAILLVSYLILVCVAEVHNDRPTEEVLRKASVEGQNIVRKDMSGEEQVKDVLIKDSDDFVATTAGILHVNDSSTPNSNETQKLQNEMNTEDEVTGNNLTYPYSYRNLGQYIAEENKENMTELDHLYFTEDPIDGTISPTEVHDAKKFQRRAFSDGDSEFIEEQIVMPRRTSPHLDAEMVRQAFQEEKNNKIRNILIEQQNAKTIQKRTFDILGMFGFKPEEKNIDVVKVIKEVSVPVPYPEEKKIPVPVHVEVERPIAVEVPKPYPVPVEKKIYYPVKEYINAPYPVYKKVPYLVKVAVEKPVPVAVAKPYPVYIEKKIPYPVEKQIPYPVKVPVDRPVPMHIPVLKNIYYPVEKKVAYPVPVPVEKPIPVPVEKPYPIYIEKKVPVPVEKHVAYPGPVEQKPDDTNSHSFIGSELEKESAFVPSVLQHASETIGSNSYQPNELARDNSFVPLDVHLSIEHDHSKIQKKKDEEDLTSQATKKEQIEETETTTHPSKETTGNKNKNEEQVFGKKIKKI